jgi:putative oxidoreductase
MYCLTACIAEDSAPAALPQLIGAVLSIFILIGLWTPLFGTLTCLDEIWILFSRAGDLWIPIILATLSATLAMIGPGAWSVDAWLYGRKHIEMTDLE